jgi:hypothetical protein
MSLSAAASGGVFNNNPSTISTPSFVQRVAAPGPKFRPAAILIISLHH